MHILDLLILEVNYMKWIYTLLFLLLCSCADKHKDVVAEFDGQEILLSELSERTRQEMFDLLNMAYEIKMKAVDDLIKERLLEKEAQKKGVSVEQYIDSYIKLNADSLALVNSGAASGNQLHWNGKQRGYLIQALADSLFRQAKVERYVYPPKQPELVIEDLPVHYRGNLDASVSLVVISDFDCKRCIEFEKTLQLLYDKYQKHVKFGFVNFAGLPTLPVLACEAAAKQDKFWVFHDAAFQHKEMADSSFLFNFAKEEGMDITQFKCDLFSEETYRRVDHTINELAKRGLFATPTVIINNRLVYMTNSFEELSRLLDNDLN